MAAAAGWDRAALRDLVGFGAGLTLKRVINYSASNVDYFVIGRRLGAADLGFYTRAYGLMTLPLTQLSRVIMQVLFPAFARIQDDTRLVAGYSKVVTATSLVSFPFLVGLVLVAPSFIAVVYGDKWLPAVLPLEIMTAAGMMKAVTTFVGSIADARGQVLSEVRRQVVYLILLVLGTVVGSHYGTAGVAAAVVVASFCMLLMMQSFLGQMTGMRWRTYLAALWPALAATGVMATAVMLTQTFLVRITTKTSPLMLFTSTRGRCPLLCRCAVGGPLPGGAGAPAGAHRRPGRTATEAPGSAAADGGERDMPGIAALIGGRAERMALDPLLAGIQVGPTERAAAIAVNGAVLGHVRLGLGGEEGGIARRGPYVLALWGAGPGLVPQANGQVGSPGSPGSPGNGLAPAQRPLVEELLDRIAAQGPQAIADLDGIAACCLYDEHTETAYLANDRLGFARLYYRVDGGRLLIASRAAAIADSAVLDLAAVGQLLQVGYPLADRTLYAAVKLLPPASFATWHAGQFLIRRLWEPPAPATAAIGVDEAAAALEQAVTRATERALDPHLRAVLPISGGLDSRLLLGIARSRSELVTLSFGHGHSRDVTFGGRLARVAGTSHRSVPLPSDYMAVLGPRAVYLTEGMAPVESAHMLCLNPALAGSPEPSDLGLPRRGGERRPPGLGGAGGGGDGAAGGRPRPVRAPLSRGLLRRRAQAPGAEAILARDGGRRLRHLLQHLSAGRRRDRARRAGELRAPAAAVRGLPAHPVRSDGGGPRPVRRSRGGGDGARLAARGPAPAAGLSPALIKSFPDLARVPHTATGVPLLGSPLGLALRRRVEWCRWHGVARLTHGLVRPHDHRQYAHYGEWIRTAAQSFFADLVADHDHLGDLLDLRAAADLFRAHLDGKVDAHGRLSAFATLALFRRQLARRNAAEPERPAALAR